MANFYSSDKWHKFRNVIINDRLDENGNTICEYCHKPIYKLYDIILHHIEPLNELTYQDATKSLNPNNILIVHHSCHNKIHNQMGSYAPQHKNYIVYGPPLAGKHEWVDNNNVKGDLVLDIDNIWECITQQPRYIKSDRLKSLVFDIRDTILLDIRHNTIKYNNCYIVGGYKLQSERERLASELNAELIFIDTPKEECIKKARDLRLNDYIKFINEWFEMN